MTLAGGRQPAAEPTGDDAVSIGGRQPAAEPAGDDARAARLQLAEFVDVLREHERLGLLGTSPAEAIRQSERFLVALPHSGRVIDLGSGGGLPGLVIAVLRPTVSLVLLDVRQRRTDQLARAVSRLRLTDRVDVVCDDAANAGRQPELAASFDAAVARSFGPPLHTLRMARPFLRIGGRLIISEPPGADRVWPSEILENLRLTRTDAPPNLFVAEAR